MAEKRKRLVLLDAHAIIHRAYHALPEFTTRDGFPTGAVYGFVAMILKIIDDLKPDYLVAAYDLPKPTFRHEAFAEYKGKRAETDEALKMQFDITREFAKIFSIPVYDAEGFEADDIIGTIVEQTRSESDLEIIIASGDMDTLQLVEGDRVRVFTLRRGFNDTVLYDEEAVMARFGFPPKLIVDYKALKGDPSDNIPGIRGIGEKTATALVQTFGPIEEIYRLLEHEGEEYFIAMGFSKRVVKLLREGRDDAEFSKILATIRRDAPIEFKLPSEPWFERVDVEAVIRFFEKYEFRSLPQRFLSLIERFGRELPRRESDEGQREGEEKREEVIEDDPKLLREASVILHLLDSDFIQPTKDDILNETGAKTLREAYEILLARLSEIPKLAGLFQYIERPLIPIVEEMERNGIRIDLPFFEKLAQEYQEKLHEIEERIFEMTGERFNLRSPKQLSEVLFEKMKLPTKGIKKSKSGAYSTSIDTLEKLRDVNEVIPLIIEYRELEKLLSTYIEVIPKLVGPDGRIHAEFLQNGTATGRFASRNPNLQNIPTRTELGRRIREGFIADEGNVLVSFDYSQIELRVLALLSGDEALIEIFREGKDIHRSVAARIAGVPEEKVDREMRRKAKVVNFGILYGMGIRSLQKEMGTTREEAERFYHGFFTHFPRAAAFLEETKAFAHAHGYTETLFGRRRQFRSINSPLPYIRAMAERMALNAPIQGTAADLIKLAMVRIHDEIKKKHPKAKEILQIHDEIIYELPEGEADDFSNEAKELMESLLTEQSLKPFAESGNPEILSYANRVPLLVHSSSGKHWGELK